MSIGALAVASAANRETEAEDNNEQIMFVVVKCPVASPNDATFLCQTPLLLFSCFSSVVCISNQRSKRSQCTGFMCSLLHCENSQLSACAALPSQCAQIGRQECAHRLIDPWPKRAWLCHRRYDLFCLPAHFVRGNKPQYEGGCRYDNKQ